MTEKIPPYLTGQGSNVTQLFKDDVLGLDEGFRILISHTSKWDTGYLKLIDYGFLSNARKIKGCHQRYEHHTLRHSRDRLDRNGFYREMDLEIGQVEPILERIFTTTISLGGPPFKTSFVASFDSLSISQNNHTITTSWHALDNEYDQPLQEIWSMVDDLITFEV